MQRLQCIDFFLSYRIVVGLLKTLNRHALIRRVLSSSFSNNEIRYSNIFITKWNGTANTEAYFLHSYNKESFGFFNIEVSNIRNKMSVLHKYRVFRQRQSDIINLLIR